MKNKAKKTEAQLKFYSEHYKDKLSEVIDRINESDMGAIEPILTDVRDELERDLEQMDIKDYYEDEIGEVFDDINIVLGKLYQRFTDFYIKYDLPTEEVKP